MLNGCYKFQKNSVSLPLQIYLQLYLVANLIVGFFSAGTQYLHKFCVYVVNSIVSPFILHEVAIEAAHYLARNNPSLILQHLRSSLTLLVQKCQQM